VQAQKLAGAFLFLMRSRSDADLGRTRVVVLTVANSSASQLGIGCTADTLHLGSTAVRTVGAGTSGRLAMMPGAGLRPDPRLGPLDVPGVLRCLASIALALGTSAVQSSAAKDLLVTATTSRFQVTVLSDGGRSIAIRPSNAGSRCACDGVRGVACVVTVSAHRPSSNAS
jgi:hypothetical protein